MRAVEIVGETFNRHRLAEGRDAYLYHGTELINALQILRDNRIEGYTEREWLPDAVSATRDWRMAHKFGTFFERTYPTIIVLDQTKLSQRHKIVPHADKDSDGDYWYGSRGYGTSEAEERIIGSISPLDAYLVSVTIHPALLQAACRDRDWRAYAVEEDRFPSQAAIVRALKALVQNPKLNVVRPKGIDAMDAAWAHEIDKATRAFK